MRRGKLVQFILDKFEADPQGAWTTADLIMEHYNVTFEEIEKKHRVAMIRAMKSVADSEARLVAGDNRGARGQYIIYDRTNLTSYATYRAKGDSFTQYQMPWKYYSHTDKYDHEKDAKKVSEKLKDCSKYLEPGENWYDNVEKFKAKIEGDTERYEELKAKREAEMAAFTRSSKRMFSGTPSFEDMKNNAGVAVYKLLTEYPEECEAEGIMEFSVEGVPMFQIVRVTEDA